MPRKAQPTTPSAITSPPVMDEIVEWDKLPKEYENGRPNPEHDRAILAAVARLCFKVSVGQAEFPKGFNPDQVKNFYLARAKMRGIEPKHLMDVRSEGDKLIDAAERLLAAPETLFETPDLELDVLEREFQKAVDGCDEIIQGRRCELLHEDELERERERIERGKDWLRRVQRVKRLREWVRTTRVPKGEDPVKKVAAFEAAKTLLFMLYVTRSSMAMSLREGKYKDLKVHLVGPPHCKFAVDTWAAMNGVDWPTSGPHKGDFVRGAIPYEGVLLMASPGLGKTTFVMACEGYFASTDDMMQGVHLHASERKSEEKLAYVKDMFDNNTAMGRRRDALFPGKSKTKRHNNTSTLNLHSRHEKESPTLQSAGVGSKGLGGNTNKQWWDDVVPLSDRDEPTERERRHTDLMFTWKTRNRGQGTFIMATGYPHHYDDALMRIYKGVKAKEVMFLVSMTPCGGPEPTIALNGQKLERFHSPWPEVYPRQKLEAMYKAARNPTMWAANYMLDPRAESAQLVKRVRFYDPTENEHTEFINSAQFHVSVDPTATSRETSDHAGVLYFGLGEVMTKDPEGETHYYETRLRLIDAARLHINQIDLADHIAQFVVQRPTYQVHLEVHSSNGSATKDFLEREYDLEVVAHSPSNKSKELRLKACSLVIDNSSKEFPAAVEFPGVRGANGVLECDPRYEWVVRQLVNFGVESHDDAVDATSQIVNHFLRTGELVAGDGEATRKVRQAIQEKGDPRVLKMLKEYESGPKRRDIDREDWSWFANRN